MADKALDDSLRLSTITIGIHIVYRIDSVREASTKGIPLIEICKKLLLAVV